GRVPAAEAYEVWNMGLGLLLAVKAADAGAIEGALARAGHRAYRAGSIVEGPREVRLIGA
ncbi:MAG TPA: phosphoribosylformylglycinamidine cyclo-ligase, partial [Candidatus Eisenbacteria bacterium]